MRKRVFKPIPVVSRGDESRRGEPDQLLVDKDAGAFEPEYVEIPAPPEFDSLLPFLQERIVLELPSDLSVIDCVVDYLNGRLIELRIVDPEESDVLVALDEAIVNAIKHGNKCDSRKAVKVIAELNSEGAQFTVMDEGAGFNKDEVPDPTAPSRLLEPSGRGLLLISHIMDDVCHNECGNAIRMFIRSRRSSNPHDVATADTDPE